MFKSGFVAIIGRPNVGKSTFINQVLGEKISIISSKPQTTRNRIRGIFTTVNEQIIFIDTPGIHKPHHQLGNIMNADALQTLNDVDLILLLVDGTASYGSGDAFVISELKKVRTPVFLVFNKIDLIKDKAKLMENVISFTNAFSFREVFYISALKGDNLRLLLERLRENLTEGPLYYPTDQKTDHPESFIIGEIIREKVLQLTKEEVPHSVAVVVEEISEDLHNPELTNIRAVIYVERTSQRKIIIGSGGTLIKHIGSLARKEIVLILGQKIFLDLWVKVEPDWRNKMRVLQRFGFTKENN